MEFLLFFRRFCLNGQGVDLPAHHLAQRIVNQPVAGERVFTAEGSGVNGEAVMAATGAGARVGGGERAVVDQFSPGGLEARAAPAALVHDVHGRVFRKGLTVQRAKTPVAT